ncbi:HAD family hydrolase [Pullulanibacillus sp. KACC 23026]|uniref:HAD family hydrolase n=1 Tax=Pullulanibacillus sp. KACC 23026 TaxID=3028315 RepID=UPI0023B015B7|nr:HAD family hydrolase [Pullulanibacillus sp. KACC 23026]WEG14929.1 HAD family hydrolase [Pullulanibacillus sp. KACC 23026]
MLFDLDETLLDRTQAVEQLFLMILEKCYGDVKQSVRTDMLKTFKAYDTKSYGHNDKTTVLESFFDEFPPKYRLPRYAIQDFWNYNFPHCFIRDQKTINIVNKIKERYQVAIITNGSTQRQKAKIMNTELNSCFNLIIISEEVGLRKPDKRIFELALTRLSVQPENALFVGDDLEKDIGGCQNAGMKGIWFNPHKIKNETDIKPDAEIHSFDGLLSYLTQLPLYES